MMPRDKIRSVIGVDPGAKGGLAILDTSDGALVAWLRMPMLKIKAMNLVDATAISEWLAERTDLYSVAVIEQNNSRPSQSAQSGFSQGRNQGAVEALLLDGPRRVEFVTPAVWKKQMQLSSDKQRSLDTARVAFGVLRGVDWSVKANDGIAEAALLAKWWLDKRSSA